MSETALVKIGEARQLLAVADDLMVVLEIRDRAAAMNVYATAKGAGELANEAKEVQLRAERKAGGFLAGMDKAKGGQPFQHRSTGCIAQPVENETYAELGIEKTQAHRWQMMAELPVKDFEEYVAETKAEGKELTSAAVYKMAQKQRQEQEHERTKANVANVPISDLKYRTIVIDPPWPVQKILRDERPNQDVFDYPTMTIEEIGRLPVAALADPEGCHLYLWVTHKHLPDGLDLVSQWGFNYQCLMTWVKPTGMTPFSWMYNTEHVIFARRGNLNLQTLGLKLSLDGAGRGHSVKPDAFYERVMSASPAPRLEMFARQLRDDFDAWGNEIAGMGKGQAVG